MNLLLRLNLSVSGFKIFRVHIRASENLNVLLMQEWMCVRLVGLLESFNTGYKIFCTNIWTSESVHKMSAALAHNWSNMRSFDEFQGWFTAVHRNSQDLRHFGRNINTLLHNCEQRTFDTVGYQWKDCTKNCEDLSLG